MASVQAPTRQRTTILPTPLVADVIFSERVVNQTRVVPAYGTAHPNATRWPDHKFAYAKERPEPENQDVYDYYYVADRANQDNYNFEFTDCDVGGQKFQAVERTYVTPREDWVADNTQNGATMPDVPAAMFDGTYVQSSNRQTRIGDEVLDSLYVMEKKTYIQKSTLIQNDYDEALSGNLQTTQTLYYRGETVGGTGTAQVETLTVIGTVDAGTAASRVLSIPVNPVADETVTINGNVFTFKAAVTDPNHVLIGASAAATQAALVTAVNNAGIGGTFAAFAANNGTFTWDTVGTAGNAIAVSETMAGASNAWAGSTLTGGVATGAGNMTLTVTSAAVTGSPLAISVAVAAGDTASQIALKVAAALDANAAVYSKFLTTVNGAAVSITRRTQAANDGTLNLGLALGTATGPTAVPTSTNTTAGSAGSATAIETIFADSTSTFWGLQGDFTSREGVQLTHDWFAVTTRQVVPTEFAENGRTYQTVVDFAWPAVLGATSVDIWNRVKGGSDQYFQHDYTREAYRGPCKAVIVERFYIDPPVAVPPVVMLPLPINLQTPFFGVNIGPTLHTARTVTISSGTEHPVYAYTAGSWVFPATSPTDWPSSLIASDEIRPFRGGYLKTQITVYPPSYT